jgi:uncharacterized membrane protein
MSALLGFLFKYRPLIYQKGTIAFRPFWPWYVSALLAAASVLGAYLIYRRAAGAVTPGWRAALGGLRGAIFLILLLIFLQPVLVLHSVIPQKSFVAVVYDLSKSMDIRDGADRRSRLDTEKELLRPAGNPLLEGLGRKFKLRFFRFSGAADRASGFEDQPRHGSVTDLERSLEQVAAELGNIPVSGIVLVTDGADNHSTALAATAAKFRARGIPVYPVGIGSPEFSRDTELVSVSAPRQALKDAMIEADVSIRARGYAGRRARLVVKERERVLQSRDITLGSDGEVKNTKVLFAGDSAGPRLFSVRVEPFPDEILTENNDQNVLIRVIDEQPPVLYVEGEPRWLYGFLRRAAAEDKNLHLVTMLRQANGKLLRQGVESSATLEKGFPSDKAELFHYKGLILGSVEASFFTFDQLRIIQDFVSQRGGGFLMLGGRFSFREGGYMNTPVEDLLPVNLRAGGVPEVQDVEFKVRLTGYGGDHPVTRVSVAEEENRKRWDDAPALVGLNPTSGPKPGATVLAQGTLPGARGQSPVVLAFQRFGRGKSMALLTASTWLWRMEQDSRDHFHEMFWRQMLRWLVSDVDDPVVLETDRRSYSLDEAVVLRAEVRDPSFLELNNAQVSAQVKAPSGQVASIPLTWDVSKEGQYSASFKPIEEGIYEASAEAFQAGKSLGTAKLNFRVADSNEEFHNAAMNEDLLKRLAADTGGHFYTPRDVSTLPEDISYVNNGASRVEEKELWDMPFLFLLLVGASGTEWALRKRKGLA